MGRFRLFAVAAATATVAGLTAPAAVDAAPAAGPTHTTRPHHSVPAAPAPTRSGAAVQWSTAANGKVSGLVHYPGGGIARITPPTRHSANGAARMQTAVEHAGDAPNRRPVLTAADVPAADQARITGRVTDRELQPLANVDVGVYGGDSDEPTASTSTNANGYYSLVVAPGDTFVEFDGSEATGGNADATGYVGTFDEILLAAGDHVIRNHRLQPGAELRVRVTDRSGHPLAGVAPYLQPVMPYVETPSNGAFGVGFEFDTADVTGADGTFTLRGVPSDAVLVCFSTDVGAPTGGSDDALGYVGRCARHPLAPAPSTVVHFPTVQLSSAAGGAVGGAVTNAHGDPLADAEVFVNGRHTGELATTADDGTYRATGLPPGKYHVCALGPYPATTELGLEPHCENQVQVRRGKVSHANFTLHRGGAISGTITGPTGAPVAGVGVDVSGSGINGGFAETDADGHYLVNGLATGDYRVCFDTSEAVDPDSPTGDRNGCYRQKAPVAAQSGSVRQGIDAQLRLAGAVAGRITGAGGAGLADVDVELQQLSGNFDGGSGETDENGNYRITDLPAGSYLICLFSYDLTAGPSHKCDKDPVEVQIGATAQRDESLAPAANRGTIAVTVRDEQGRRVQGVDVGALKPCTGSPVDPFVCASEPLFGHAGTAKLVASEMVDTTGTALIDARKPGTYAVCLFAYYGVTTAGAPPTGYTDRCAGQTFSVTVQSGATTHVHLTLHPGGRVEGRVVDPAGHPVAHVRAQIGHSAAADYDDEFGDLFGEPSPARDARTHQNGTFSVRGVRPGADAECVQVRPGKYIDTCAHHPVHVHADATTQAPDLTLQRGGSIAGIVRDAAGQRLKRAAALIFSVDATTELATATVVNRHGHYRAAGLSPGRYVVCFVAPHRVAECYRQVRWDLKHDPGRLKGTTLVRATGGHTTTGINAELRRHK